MTFLVARIDHALTRGINWLTTCLVERARGFNSSEAGDFIDHAGGAGVMAVDGEQALWSPPGGNTQTLAFDRKVGDSYCGQCGANITAVSFHACPQSPAASAGRGESSSSGVSAGTPATAPSEERGCSCIAAPHNYCARHGATLGAHPAPVEPTPGEFAAVAVLNSLADHQFRADPGSDPDFDQAGCCTCSVAKAMDECDWREHVAAEIQRRIDAAITTSQ